MKKHRISLYVFAVLAMALLVGCAAPAAETASTPVPEEIPAASPEPTSAPEAITITDMAGREVTVPAAVDHVFGANTNSTVMLYTLAPGKMIAWNIKPDEAAMVYMDPDYTRLPVLGSLYGSGKESNIEEVLTYPLDLVVLCDTKAKQKVIEAADSIEERLGIPVIVVKADMSDYDEAYAFLGPILGAEEEAEALGAYCRETVAYAGEKAALLSDKVSVYYARMDDGLTTEFKGSSNAQVLKLAGGVNVAEGDTPSGEVTLEQVVAWNPETIIIGHIGASEVAAYDAIMGGELWAETDAVKNGAVYSVPRLPFNWFDRPPSVNRVIGVKWLGNLLYPDVFDCDMTAEVKDFFSLFYHYALSDEEAAVLLGR
jgi:iron complex transport system substrate-binding protein